MTRISTFLGCLLAVALLLAACGQPVSSGTTATPSPDKGNPAPVAGWEQKWNDTVAKAKQEGSVSIYGIWTTEVRNALSQAFKEKYGINLEFTPFSRGADLLAKVQAEQRAGLFNVDVFGAGNPTILVTMKPEGVLGSMKDLLVLPEVLDPKGWRAGGVPFTDDQGYAISLIGVTVRTLTYNSTMIKDGEITTYEDLLKPQYKGKITVNDPSVTGTGNALVTHLGQIWGEEKTKDFLRRLIIDQQAPVERDNRIHLESIARGKYAIGVGPLPEMLAELIDLGAPLKIPDVKEDSRITAGAGAVGVPGKFAHPNAAVVFLNWLLTKDAQTVFAKAWGNPSTRADVSVQGINPLFVPVPGQKYYGESAEALAARGKWLEIAKNVIAEASK